MRNFGKIHARRGFTLAELLIVVAIVVLLAGIAMAFIRPQTVHEIEYDRNAETIAVAAQNHLTQLRNAGKLDSLQNVGISASGVSSTASTPTEGGYRYLFNYRETDTTERNPQMSLILPFGAIESDLAEHYYAIGFQSATGTVREVFWRETPFEAYTADHLMALAESAELRKAEKVGYYAGEADDGEVAFAQLPTPQLTISNYENLTLSVFLPKVRELEALGKRVAIRVSLGDEKGLVYEDEKDGSGAVTYPALTYEDTAIYRSYSYGDQSVDQKTNGIVTGTTYQIILDTPDNSLLGGELTRPLAENGNPAAQSPKGKFESWAALTKAFAGSPKADGRSNAFLLGDNVRITVTVFCLDSELREIDPTFMPRSGSVVFNGWFDTLKSSDSVTIASGRHLQNLGKLTELNASFAGYLPDPDNDYAGASRGAGYFFTDRSGDINKKYDYRKYVRHITKAEQMMSIDFNCPEWKDADGNPIPFEPINPYPNSYYYGNYLSIKHLYVDAPFYAGLFGYANGTYLYDVLLVNPNVSSRMPAHVAQYYEMGVGALIGTSRASGAISNCQAYLEKENGSYLPEKYRVTGACYVGGLIGVCEDEEIRQNSASVNTGESDGSSLYVGGLIGCIMGDSSLKYSYAAGNLSGQYVGGLIGCVMEDSDNAGDEYEIASCYSAGHIEMALESAAGIIGRIDEQDGVVKSALRAHDNYCAVIYGAGNGNAGDWTYTKKDELGKSIPVPIYGTFEGDGFKWLSSAAEVGVVTGGSPNIFLGADFGFDNQNYFFPQNGITYADSSYFTNVKGVAQSFLNQISSQTSNAQRQALIDSTRERLLWAQQLDTLEEMKKNYEQMLAQFREEKAVSPKSGKPYNEGGYRGSLDDVMYIDTWRVDEGLKHATTLSKSEQSKVDKSERYITVTALELLECFYDGSYKGGTVKLRDKDKWESESTEKPIDESGNDCSFMGLYGVAKGALERLLGVNGSTSTDPAKDRATLTRIFGSDGTYTNGYLYTHCLSVVHRVLDVSKDAYYNSDGEANWNDRIGEQTFYYYRDRLADKQLLGPLNSMVVTSDTRRDLLKEKQDLALSTAKDYVSELLKLAPDWTTGDMQYFKDDILAMAKDAETALDTLIGYMAGVTNDPSTTKPKVSFDELQEAAVRAYDAINLLYHYFDTDDKLPIVDASGNPVVDENGKQRTARIKDLVVAKTVLIKDKDYIDGTSYYNYKEGEGDMRGFRSVFKNVRADVRRAAAEINPGVAGALDRLEYDMYYYGNTGAGTAVDECVKDFELLLAVNWEGHDSGHRIYSAYELRNIRAMHYISSDFIYDYHDAKGYADAKDPDNTSEKKYKQGSFVDKDNGIYNNVLPYTENGDYTKFYPYLMITGRKIMGSSGSEGDRATGVLFHYGDWITADLIAADGNNHSYHTVSEAADTARAAGEAISDIRELASSTNRWTDPAKMGAKNENGVTYKDQVNDLVEKADSALAAFQTAAATYAADQSNAADYNSKLQAVIDAFTDLFNLFDASASNTIVFSDGTTQKGGVKNIVDALNPAGEYVGTDIDAYNGYRRSASGEYVLDADKNYIKEESCMRTIRTMLEKQLGYLKSIDKAV